MWGYFNILPRRAYKWVNAYYFIYNAFWRLTYCQFHKARCYTSQATTPIEHLSECRFLLLITVKVFPHTKQANGFTPVCVRKCLVKWTLWLNAEPQTSHVWAFSPVCVSAWCFKWLRCVKDFPQISQENGLSPVCVRMCWFIVPLWTNCLPQCEHSWGFSPLWIFMWSWSRDWYANCLSHTLQRCDFFGVVVFGGVVEEEERFSAPGVRSSSSTVS